MIYTDPDVRNHIVNMKSLVTTVPLTDGSCFLTSRFKEETPQALVQVRERSDRLVFAYDELLVSAMIAPRLIVRFGSVFNIRVLLFKVTVMKM